ncbi:MAG: AFG1 family ATPase [Alphaproteobacteria bacterium]|nr:AFG1 family ATPase [Alphaproteobacteria bacterium]
MTGHTPLELYRGRVADGEIAPDPGQDEAAAALDSLYRAILDSPRLAVCTKRRTPQWLQNIAGKRKSAPRKNETVRSVYIYGGVGRGKSMLMDLFYDTLPEDIPKRRVHFHAFMVGVHDYIHERRTAEGSYDGTDALLPALAAQIAEESSVLCFDEFHVTDITDAMILGRLFTALFDLGIAIVFTSNWAPEDLYEGGLQRDRFEPFIALLQERTQVIRLDGVTDYRAGMAREEGRYFMPLGGNTHRRMDQVFSHLTGGIAVKTASLSVKGRSIPVTAAAAGVARFSFAQLCEQPHGAEDYLAIAKRYHTIFLEGVPQLKYDRRNEAKRLMLLIDALYESGTKLIVSADAPPEKLYHGHDHGFEFQRTVSRLLEMQSASWP